MRKLSYRFEGLGEKSVKNIAQPIRVFRLNFTAVGMEALDAGYKGAAESTVAPDKVPSPIVLMPDSPRAELELAELMFWESIKDSELGGDYEAYLNQFPDGVFVGLARARLEDLSSGESAGAA